MMKATILLLAAMAVCSSAFAPHAALVAKPTLHGYVSFLKMSEDPKDGTFYDDEVNPEDLGAPAKTGISDGMKERLMREANQGMDSEKKQTNVILYIGVVVAILVALAGSGIFY